RTPGNTVASNWTAESLGATTRVGSVESRFNQWAEAWEAVERSPVVGQGLGSTHVHFEEGQNAFVESDINHNITLDVLSRTGVVGLSLAAIAVIITVVQGVRVWGSAAANAVAFWALSAVAVVAGLLAKGMVESILEKDRLALLLGLALGFVGAAVTRGFDLSDLEPGVRVDGQGKRRLVVSSSSGQKPSWPLMLRSGPSPHKRGRHRRD
ncbi:MAG TPA: O-antigen ligase family protein, partial [Actinomycetes bacterium]|nr:O-antigen ligase family protein [Actinomycetes bacterium]